MNGNAAATPRSFKFWRWWGLTIVSLLIMLALAAFLWVRKTAHEINQKGMNEAVEGVELLANKLHEHSLPDQLPGEMTPNEAVEWEPDSSFRAGKFDYHGYSIEILGEHPSYVGTQVRYHGKSDQHPITLTVIDLSAKDWRIDWEPIPEWWEVWK